MLKLSSCTTKSFRADGDILLRAPIELAKARAHEPRCYTDARFCASAELNGGGNARACALPVRFFFYQSKIFLNIFSSVFFIVSPR